MRSWRWPLVVLAVALIAGAIAWRACRTVEQGGREPRATLESAGRALGDAAERFKTGRITTTFTAAIPKLNPGGPLLEVASFEATETLTRTDERSVFFDLLPLGKNVTEIRVPVTYRYHLVLADPWTLDVRGATCLVRAPRIRPSLPPAIHTDRMEKRSERGWLRGGTQEQMDSLERSLTPTLSARAGEPTQLALVREPCRKRVAEFVRAWLLHEGQWREGGFAAVTVVFEDEARLDPAREPPTLAAD
jgi:HAMP domain-containing protein